MKWDENKTLCLIMRWGWMKWKQSLAFNNDDGKTLYKKKQQTNLFTKKNKKIKTSIFFPSHCPPSRLYPCTVPWNRNQKTIKGKFFNYWPGPPFWDSELQTIINTLSIRPHQLPHLPFSLPPGPLFLFLLLPLILLLFLYSLSLCTSENLRYFIK